MEIEFNGVALSSKFSQEDEAMSFVEDGIIYSCDGRKLLKATSKCFNKVIVRKETLVICDNAFQGCPSSEVVMPESLIIIGKRAFMGSMVKNIDIPDSVEELGDEVFGDCAELGQIRFGKKIRQIRHEFFHTYFSKIDVSKQKLKKIEITGAEEIADETFKEFYSLESVVLGEGLIRIGNKAFYQCNIKSIDIPNSVVEIGCEAFWLCSSLRSVDIPNSVVEIGCGAFNGCSNVKMIKLGIGLKCINDSIFRDCGIEDVVIPDNIQEIKSFAFSSCKNLKNVHFGKSLIKIGVGAFESTRLENIEIPKNVREISSYAFGDCQYLTQVQILNSNIKIEECAFEGCKSINEDCKVNLMDKYGPYLFQHSTKTNIMNFFGELWDDLTGGVEYKNPLFP